jgi:hypothetical protein
LPERDYRLLRVNLDLRRDDLQIELDAVRGQSLVHTDHVGLAPFLLEPGATERNRDGSLVQFVLQLIGDGS